MISVITPVYNGERFIESCIKVVIDQNCPNVEHIIVDGGSTDGTVEIIKQYAQKYPHIRWISEKDRGQSDAMNKGIAMAKGEIISFLNVDDFYESNALNRVLELFTDLPEPSFLVGNCNIWGDEEEFLYTNKPKNLKITHLLSSTEPPPFPLNPSAYFYHKSLHQKIGLYKVDEHYMMDIDFICKAVQAATVRYADEAWGNHRHIQGTKTISLVKSGQHTQHLSDLLEEHKKKLPLFEQYQVDILRGFYRNLYQLKYYFRRTKHYLRNPQDLFQKLRFRLVRILEKNVVS
ncbi:MAG: glycosyltransferase [Iphinoe sp. HA4291-MV1]|jgi:glycosyltransferase involved in cell wall biosynthesis|nr:glycosyltransferase [Iphinoe sp. HA4291-MV1]